MADTGGRASGFDYMRLILACTIVCWHSIGTAYGLEAAQHAIRTAPGILVVAILPLFFALSGFLVAGSLERCKTLVYFLGLRVLRIFPALIVEVLLSALIIGPLLTQLPLREYLQSPVFWHYFFNILGNIHYALPGVFENNPLSAVNGQLWTVPWELECYIAIALLTIVGAVRHRAGLAIAVVGFACAYTAYKWLVGGGVLAAGLMPGYGLVLSFLSGVMLYLYSERIIWSAALATASAVTGLAFLASGLGAVAAAVPLAYVTVYLGLLNPPRLSMLRGADYSYGIFLYGFVIQQAFTSLGAWTHHWWLNIAVCLPLAGAFAAVSWHFVEKPALGLKGALKRLEQSWLRLQHQYLGWLWLPSWLRSDHGRSLASSEYRL